MYVKRRFKSIAVEEKSLLKTEEESKAFLAKITIKDMEIKEKNINYFLDTNIVLYLLQGHEAIGNFVNETLGVFSSDNDIAISVVSVAELNSFSVRANWDANQINALNQLLQNLIITDISAKEIIARYVEIDVYSRGKYDNLPQGIRPHKMGKNDLWIAATASVLNVTLLTTDQDYMHLNGMYLAVETIPIMSKKFKDFMKVQL